MVDNPDSRQGRLEATRWACRVLAALSFADGLRRRAVRSGSGLHLALRVLIFDATTPFDDAGVLCYGVQPESPGWRHEQNDRRTAASPS
jgi:hypothetical protein